MSYTETAQIRHWKENILGVRRVRTIWERQNYRCGLRSQLFDDDDEEIFILIVRRVDGGGVKIDNLIMHLNCHRLLHRGEL